MDLFLALTFKIFAPAARCISVRQVKKINLNSGARILKLHYISSFLSDLVSLRPDQIMYFDCEADFIPDFTTL